MINEIEIKRRISYAWNKFGKRSRYLLDQRYPLALKKKIFQQCVVPVFMYGSETWTVTKKLAKKLNAAHTAMERKMLDVKWQDHITNETIKQKTKYLTSWIES